MLGRWIDGGQSEDRLLADIREINSAIQSWQSFPENPS
jgi:hypothetical protein